MKEFGGLGIPNLKDPNLCLLGSWVKRFIQNEGKLWRSIVEKSIVGVATYFTLTKTMCHSSLEGCYSDSSGYQARIQMDAW
jgi:hypothetical protein